MITRTNSKSLLETQNILDTQSRDGIGWDVELVRQTLNIH